MSPRPRRDRPGVEVRERALDVLLDLERSAPSARLRNRINRRAEGLTDRDAGLLRGLCAETLRWRRRLDHSLAACCRRSLERLDPEILVILRLGAAQLLRMELPAHAVVDTGVELARRRGRPGTAGMVNAVLRRLAREGETPVPASWPEARRLGVEGSLPDWLARRWLERYGPEEAEQLVWFVNRPPPATLRVTRRSSPAEVAAVLREGGWPAEPVEGSPDALRTSGLGIAASAPFRSGMITFQDAVAQLAAPLLGADPGETLLDACAGPGGKGLHLDDRARGRALVVAAEPSRRSLAELRENRQRLGARRLLPVRTADCAGLPTERFDRILLDAPCSGLGVLNRHPEARWNRDAGIVSRMANLQARLLRAASGRLRIGGRLLYVTCSVEPEENEGVLEPFLSEQAGFRREPLEPGLDLVPADWLTPSGDLRTLPQHHDREGYYMARLRRER